MQSRAFHGMEVAALCPDTKRVPPLARLRKTTRVCLSFLSIVTACPSNSFSPNISPFIPALFPLPEQEERRIFFHVGARRPIADRTISIHRFQQPTEYIVPLPGNSPPPPPPVNSWNAVKTRDSKRFKTSPIPNWLCESRNN